MPEGKVPRFYWDTCVFLSAIERVPDRVAVIEKLLDDADEGRIEIFTSTASITEVAFAKLEKSQRGLDAAVADKISQLWSETSPIKLVEFHELIAFAARDLVRLAMPNEWNLKPMDAIHLATAQRVGVDAFHTYDSKLNKYAKATGLRIEPPYAPVLPFPDGLKG
jgi:predicted nucleic acid-binding protein